MNQTEYKMGTEKPETTKHIAWSEGNTGVWMNESVTAVSKLADTRIDIPSCPFRLKRTLVPQFLHISLSLEHGGNAQEVGRRARNTQPLLGNKILKTWGNLGDEGRASGEKRRILRHVEGCVPATVLEKCQIAHKPGAES